MIKSIGQKVTMVNNSLQAQFFYSAKSFVCCIMGIKKWSSYGVEK